MKKTILKFPKELFSRNEVSRIPKKEFRFPHLWKLSETKKNYILSFPNIKSQESIK